MSRKRPLLSAKELQDLRDAGLGSGRPSTFASRAPITKRGKPSDASLEAEQARYDDIPISYGGYQKPRREGAE